MAGILFFQPVGVYAENVGRSLDTHLPDTRTWAAVAQCIRRGSMFSISAHSPSFEASLRFDPIHPTVGDYTVTYPQMRRQDAGTIDRVLELGDEIDLDLLGLSALTGFKHRYRVITLANDRQHTRNIWFVALEDCREIAENEHETA